MGIVAAHILFRHFVYVSVMLDWIGLYDRGDELHERRETPMFIHIIE
jgi:hypothetical protein